ncbi:hypothetical protein RNAN_0455 [Rheinheimera nanhaiensis E407-8]|uniref:Uncharacterized protein n=1 Tax=Rheinheimera nanhaiensis E407-8 TaxID=562729 RepID=I1DTV9_9GAMM|nr:hypothetical protein RNAN_0455 [Rheinheimera nanhaiensis E407-8]
MSEQYQLNLTKFPVLVLVIPALAARLYLTAGLVLMYRL